MDPATPPNQPVNVVEPSAPTKPQITVAKPRVVRRLF